MLATIMRQENRRYHVRLLDAHMVGVEVAETLPCPNSWT
jgi:hypothetical protein